MGVYIERMEKKMEIMGSTGVIEGLWGMYRLNCTKPTDVAVELQQFKNT